MSGLLSKFDSSYTGNRPGNYSDSDTESNSSTTSSSSSTSSDRFTNNADYYKSRTMSNKGLMINIPNYLAKVSPMSSGSAVNSPAIQSGNTEEVKRGRGKSLSQKIRDNNLLVNSNINDDDGYDNLTNKSPIDIPVEFKEIIKSRSNSISRTRTNSINHNENNNLIPVTRTRGNSIRSNTPSFTNLRNIPSSMESMNSLNSAKNSTSSILSNSIGSGNIPMKNLKKYLTTGDDAYLVDDSDEDLFVNNLSHQQQQRQQHDLMFNMASSAHVNTLGDINNENHLERIKKETKKIDSLHNQAISRVTSIDMNMGLNFGGFASNKDVFSTSVESDRTLKPNTLNLYKKVEPVDLYGGQENSNNEEDYAPSSSWFLGGNV
ncbi:hypothetical protein QEN19_001815 [Hanseniaspora menglaensis]